MLNDGLLNCWDFLRGKCTFQFCVFVKRRQKTPHCYDPASTEFQFDFFKWVKPPFIPQNNSTKVLVCCVTG